MDCDTRSSSVIASELQEKGTQKISVSDQINSLQYANMKSDNFIVDMERFSHLTNKDVSPNSRIAVEKLQKSLSRKGSQRGGDKKINSRIDNEKDSGGVATFSPREVSTPEKPMVATMGTTNHPINPQGHHQIIIKTSNVGTTTTTVESKLSGRRFSFRRSSPSWAIDPRRILFFFATLSSMGTILLIYFTLSMAKHSGDDNSPNWQ